MPGSWRDPGLLGGRGPVSRGRILVLRGHLLQVLRCRKNESPGLMLEGPPFSTPDPLAPCPHAYLPRARISCHKSFRVQCSPRAITTSFLQPGGSLGWHVATATMGHTSPGKDSGGFECMSVRREEHSLSQAHVSSSTQLLASRAALSSPPRKASDASFQKTLELLSAAFTGREAMLRT